MFAFGWSSMYNNMVSFCAENGSMNAARSQRQDCGVEAPGRLLCSPQNGWHTSKSMGPSLVDQRTFMIKGTKEESAVHQTSRIADKDQHKGPHIKPIDPQDNLLTTGPQRQLMDRWIPRTSCADVLLSSRVAVWLLYHVTSSKQDRSHSLPWNLQEKWWIMGALHHQYPAWLKIYQDSRTADELFEH